MIKAFFMRSILLIAVIFCLFSCNKQEESPLPPLPERKSYPGVEKAFWSHFTEFEDEASSRGWDIDLAASGITGKFENTLGPEVGHCNSDGHETSSISIDSLVWYGSTGLVNESILFHELGHCFLGRGHDNSANALGECVSIMNTGSQKLCIFSYTLENREAYLDELFK